MGVVTGAGKTTFAEMCMRTHISDYPNGTVVIIVPTLALLDQWFVSLREDLGVAEGDIGLYSGEGRSRVRKTVSLMVLNTARTVAPGFINNRDAFLIVDECHRAASPENLRALDGAAGPTLGMSATPERDYDDWMAEHVVPRLGSVIFRYDYEGARSDGVISPFELRNVEVDLMPSEADRYGELTRSVSNLVRRLKGGEDVQERLKRALQLRSAIAAQAKMRIPVAIRLLDDHRGQRAIVFHERIAAADEILQAVLRRGHRAAIYHSGIAGPVRRDNLRLYRMGAYAALVTCRALDEGVNVPDTEVAIVASSTASTRQRIQRLGRVLRPAPGKSLALIYTLFATDLERDRLAREEENGIGAEAVKWLRVAQPPHA